MKYIAICCHMLLLIGCFGPDQIEVVPGDWDVECFNDHCLVVRKDGASPSLKFYFEDESPGMENYLKSLQK